ncbi:hypothetical protein KIH87_18930 [Paraneptunicella aestuarii]|uniref:hypothetical protein n=1 Tax=Paraneptunicella aestuarii TaxID=2831148 RepID=UPI001E5F30E5|nr:hypothetical protein [Paraneptunicella aestuarii]UAA38709.1 hypothetical protein KIH87_18930 [Paraneptunicella aestuarii]
MSIYAILVGLFVALMLVRQGYKLPLQNHMWLYSALLSSFPIFYWLFALYVSDYDAFFQEFLIGLCFLAWAMLGARINPSSGILVLAMGFTAHGLYDIVHGSFFVNDGAPGWWPEFCGVIDVVIACYLVFLALKIEPDSESVQDF